MRSFVKAIGKTANIQVLEKGIDNWASEMELDLEHKVGRRGWDRLTPSVQSADPKLTSIKYAVSIPASQAPSKTSLDRMFLW